MATKFHALHTQKKKVNNKCPVHIIQSDIYKEQKKLLCTKQIEDVI